MVVEMRGVPGTPVLALLTACGTRASWPRARPGYSHKHENKRHFVFMSSKGIMYSTYVTLWESLAYTKECINSSPILPSSVNFVT